MKKSLLLLLCAATSVGIIAFADVIPAPKPPAAPDISKMQADIQRLQAKVEMLELRTKGLESTVEQLKRTHVPTPLSSQVPGSSVFVPSINPSQPPKIWGQGEVNGWTYYIVPCEQQSR